MGTFLASTSRSRFLFHNDKSMTLSPINCPILNDLSFDEYSMNGSIYSNSQDYLQLILNQLTRQDIMVIIHISYMQGNISQCSNKLSNRRNKHLSINWKEADVSFVLDFGTSNPEVPSHKRILSIGSLVFEPFIKIVRFNIEL